MLLSLKDEARRRWLWLRRAGSGWWAAVGLLSLVGFALALTRAEATFAGRAYAACGGVYIACALTWLWLIERQRPTITDILALPSHLRGH